MERICKQKTKKFAPFCIESQRFFFELGQILGTNACIAGWKSLLLQLLSMLSKILDG